MKTLPLISAAITVFLPFLLQKTGLSEKHGFRMKMLCALAYLLTGVLSAVAINKVTAFSLMILGALGLGLLGDFFLEFKGKKFFPLGVVFFALGHIVYSVTFICVGAYKALMQILTVTAITLALTLILIVFAKTKLKLKGKKKMLLFYAPVLIFAFASALMSGFLAIKAGNLSYGLCLIFGGGLFFSSDIMIGAGKGGVKRPQFLHNAVSYTYFAAQALFALSICFQ